MGVSRGVVEILKVGRDVKVLVFVEEYSEVEGVGARGFASEAVGRVGVGGMVVVCLTAVSVAFSVIPMIPFRFRSRRVRGPCRGRVLAVGDLEAGHLDDVGLKSFQLPEVDGQWVIESEWLTMKFNTCLRRLECLNVLHRKKGSLEYLS